MSSAPSLEFVRTMTPVSFDGASPQNERVPAVPPLCQMISVPWDNKALKVEYAKGVGVRLKQPHAGNASEVKAFREAIRKGLSQPKGDGKWPIPYAVRRTAWHALDHAWEMEDRIP